MSRRAKALTAAAFAYAQWALGLFIGLFLTRFLIRSLGQDVYGMWLATGALLAYAALADLGILGVMPWLFAEADGAKDEPRKRTLLAHGLAAGVVGGALYLVFALALWVALPRVVPLSAADLAALRGPVIVMAASVALGYPARVFVALRAGFQDYRFTGLLALVQTVLNLALVVGFTVRGAGLYGIALGAGVPNLVGGVAAALRTYGRDRALLRGWPPLSWAALRPIVTSGAGQWMGTLGWQLASASDSVVIAYLGHRELVPMFVVTSRLGMTLMQMSWTLPESASVGLAQLNAEGNGERVADVVAALLRIHLLFAGAIGCVVLGANFGFVRIWLGPDLYGGARLNAAIAIAIVSLSVAHAVTVPAAVLGQRVRVGWQTLLNGVLHVVFAVALGRTFGLVGVAAATSVSALVTTIPSCARMLAKMTPLSLGRMLREIVLPWAVRILPCAGLAVVAGWVAMQPEVTTSLGRRGPLVASLAAGAAISLAYMLWMRPITRDLPFGPRLRRLLGAARLV